MSTENVKKFLEEQTGVLMKNWSRVSKKKLADGSELRVFLNKNSGETVHIQELTDGSIKFVDENTIPAQTLTKKISSSELKKSAIQLIKNFANDRQIPNQNDVGYNKIPSLFRFSFMEEANDDCSEEIEEMSESGSINDSVKGFHLFIWPISDAGIDSCLHYKKLLDPFLSFNTSEIQEATFFIEDDISLKDVYKKLKAKGFKYDSDTCMLSNLIFDEDE